MQMANDFVHMLIVRQVVWEYVNTFDICHISWSN